MRAMVIGTVLTLTSVVAAGFFFRLGLVPPRGALTEDPLKTEMADWPGLIGLLLNPRWRRIYNGFLLAGAHALFLTIHVFTVGGASQDPSWLGFLLVLGTLITASAMFAIWGTAFRIACTFKREPDQRAP